MHNLEGAKKNMITKQKALAPYLEQGLMNLNEQLKNIEDYYLQFYEILDYHKARVIKQVKQ